MKTLHGPFSPGAKADEVLAADAHKVYEQALKFYATLDQLHRTSDVRRMRKEPSGLVGHAKSAMQLMAGHALLGRGHEVERLKPEVQLDMAAFHHALGGHADVEGYFSIFKRGMRGVYQHCAEKHLHRYLSEYDFRFNHRVKLGFNDGESADLAIRGAAGKRVTHRLSH